MQANSPCAFQAETLFRQDIKSTPAPTSIDASYFVATSLSPDGFFDSEHRSGFLALTDICKRIRHSKSWAYANGIVPLTDDRGNPTNCDKTPPFPWLQLPPPCVEFGKKLWSTADVDQWLRDMRTHAKCRAKVLAADAQKILEVLA